MSGAGLAHTHLSADAGCNSCLQGDWCTGAVFSVRVGQKCRQKSHVHKTTKNPRHFKMQSWQPRLVKGEVVITSSQLVCEIRLGDAGRSFRFDFASLYPSRRVIPPWLCVWPSARCQSRPFLAFLRLQVICASVPKTGTDGRQPSVSTVYPKKNTIFQSQILSLQPSHPMSLLDTHQLSEDFRIASR